MAARRLHLGYAAGLLVIVGLLAWLTASQGRVDAVLVGYVLVLGAAYRIASTTRRLEPNGREWLVFAVLGVGLVGLLAVLSGGSASYLVFILVTILIFALFALGLNLEYGFTGIINFGHVAFMGIGAYATTLLSRRWLPQVGAVADGGPLAVLLVAGSALLVFVLVALVANVAAEVGLASLRKGWDDVRRARVAAVAAAIAGLAAAGTLVLVVGHPPGRLWAGALLIGASVAVGMLGAAAVGLLLGVPTLRLRADYLAIVTIGAAEIIRRAFLNEQAITDGPRGVVGFPLPLADAPAEWAWLAALGRVLDADAYKLLLLGLLLASLLSVFILSEVLVRSPYGRVLKAIREDEEVAAALGKNVFSYKLQALAIGSAVAALAGSFFAWQQVYISPMSFLPIYTFYAWIIIVVGGLGNNRGTILGALILWTFFEVTRFLDLDAALGITSVEEGALRVALIGLLLVLLMMFKPEGILGRREEMVLGR